MKCNGCWADFEPNSQCVATHCGHLFCLKCAQSILESDESACVICENILTKSNVKLVNILQGGNAYQLTLCGQTPETAMTSALASVNFYIGQVELQAQLRESQLQRKLEKVQEACKKKLQEVHNGYTQAKRKYMEVAQEKQNLEADRAELQQKRPIQELHPSAAGGALGDPNGNMVTTIHRKQVFLNPGHADMGANLMHSSQQHLGGFLKNPARRQSTGPMRSATPPQRTSGGSGPVGRNALNNIANISPLDSPGRGNVGNAGFDSPGRRPATAVRDLLGGSPSGMASGLASF
ncbi:hypothetical protein WJX75_005544 [Coccomyxa subellipsoidea]|uniref:RING-type domain-containing protein n=1 Tax=Coccomyxa subellipsoidea TaxID=248742 RepID=A0ABR2YJI0_9CHLO